MRVTILHGDQRTPEWAAARLGRLTGSDAAAIYAEGRSKGSVSVQRVNLRVRLALERITGQSAETEVTVSPSMQRGRDKEAAAIGAYEAATGQLVQRTAFLSADALHVGCSLDGHIGDDREGILEVKCPNSATHLGYIRAGVFPQEYEAQCRHNVWVSGAAWCDFVSFDDRMPAPLRLFIVRATRQQLGIPAHEVAALAFLAEVAAEEAAIRALMEARS